MGLEMQTDTIAELQAALEAERTAEAQKGVAVKVTTDVQKVAADTDHVTRVDTPSDSLRDLKTESLHEHPQPEITNEDSLASISMIELAEVLDQHRIWVESAGETGAKADLSGVSLAKADL